MVVVFKLVYLCAAFLSIAAGVLVVVSLFIADRAPQTNEYLGIHLAAGADNATAPFATRRDGGTYDATTLLRCKAAGDREYGNCPAGILRMEDGQASIVIQSQLGQQFTINFMKDYVNATVGEVKPKLNDDLWTVTRDNGEVYEVPLSAINGG